LRPHRPSLLGERQRLPRVLLDAARQAITVQVYWPMQ
jgi:hypothetical protein